MGRLDHLTKVREHFGTTAALLRISDRVIQSVGIEVHKVLWQDGTIRDKSITADPRFEFRRLTVEEVAAFAADPENRMPASSVDRARSDQQFCFGTLCGARLAAYAWFAIGAIDAEQNAGVPMSYPNDTACAFRGFTHPEFRGQLVHAGNRPQLLAALAELGVKKLIALVSWTNWPSQRYCYRVGYQDIGYLVSVGPRRFRRWFGPRNARLHGIHFGVPLGNSRPFNELRTASSSLKSV